MRASEKKCESMSFHPNPAAKDWYFIAKQPAPAPHLAHPEGYAALRIVLVTVPRVSTRSTIGVSSKVDVYPCN